MKETITKILNDTRNKPDIEVQRALTAAFPGNVKDADQWREYGREIFKQSGRKMYGI